MIKIKNLTPHPIKILGADEPGADVVRTYEPSGKEIRVPDGIENGTYQVGDRLEVPSNVEGDVIVSKMTAMAVACGVEAPEKLNLHIVEELIRDDDGHIVGATGIVPVRPG